MKCNKTTRVGSEAQYVPRTVGEILHDYLENSNEPLARAYRERPEEAEEQGWSRNTDLAVDLKTILHSDHSMKTGREYLGVLRRDSDAEIEDFRCRDAHYTFTEVVCASSVVRRNVCIYEGKYITCTKRLDGTVRLNFKNLKVDAAFNADGYALEVANEIREALNGFIEE